MDICVHRPYPLMVLLPGCSPYETSTNRRGVQVGGALRPWRARGLRPPPSSGDWCRFRAAGRGLRSRSAGKRPRIREQARRRPGPRPPAGSRAERPPAAARSPCGGAGGCTFFAVCCTFVGERAASCTFFAVCCRSGRVRGFPSPAFPSKTAVQANDDEMAYRKEGAVDGPNGPKRVRIGLQSCNKPKKCARNRFPLTRASRADPARLWAVSVCGRPRVVRGRADAPDRRSPSAALSSRAEGGGAGARLHIFRGSLQARRRGRGSCTFFEVRCSERPLGGARMAPVGEVTLQKRRSE